jgi:glycosyltransferase involved in cell wall biosynthesis
MLKNKSEKTVFVNQSVGYLMVDIINAYKSQYKEAAIITGKLNETNTPLDTYAYLDKIIQYNKTSSLKRICTWIIASVQILFKILFKYRKADLFIVSNPPFATLLPLFLKNKFSLLIYDTYPDILIAHKIFKENSLVSNYWKRANRKTYNKAANLFTISESMADNLSQYVDRKKIKVIPNWSHISYLKPINKADNPFVKEYKIENKFIVLYSGNMGATHDVETIVKVADELKKEQEILFIFIGGGAKKVKIEKMIKDLSLDNCLMLPFQKPDVLPFSLGSADVGIVTLDVSSSLLSMPSKTYNLMAVGATLLCIADQKSELGELVEKYHLGKIFNKESIAEMGSFILEVKNNKELHSFYCTNAQNASQYFTSQNALLYLD